MGSPVLFCVPGDTDRSFTIPQLRRSATAYLWSRKHMPPPPPLPLFFLFFSFLFFFPAVFAYFFLPAVRGCFRPTCAHTSETHRVAAVRMHIHTRSRH